MEPGQMVGILGESGVGKTTLLLNSGTMLQPSEGIVQIRGVSVYEVAAQERARIRARDSGYLFQTLQ